MKPAKQTNQDDPPVSIELDPVAQLAGLRILIVEDMGLIAHELRLTLEDLGCCIVGVAPRLDAAAELAQTEKIDGVLLDLDLSGTESYPVADILHARGIPFIIMSGYDASTLREDCAGEPHLRKPFSHEALTELMLRTFRPAKRT